MTFINPVFQTKKIKQYIADLIIDHDYISFSNFTHADKCDFTALLLEAAGKDGEYECMTDNFEEILISLRKALAGNQDDDENFLYVLKKNAIRYYDDVMRALFEEGLENLQRERHEWLDYTAKHGCPDEAYERYRENLA